MSTPQHAFICIFAVLYKKLELAATAQLGWNMFLQNPWLVIIKPPGPNLQTESRI